jgi:hypothetical protein
MGTGHCIISLATADKRYAAGLARLAESARKSGFEGDILTWPPDSFPAGCPQHREVPFAFKPYCFREARARGMDLVLWLDSACVVLRPLDTLFRQIAERGYVLFRNRDHKVGEWASDAALARLALSRDEAMRVPEVNAAAIGLNMKSPIGTEFLDRWYEEARNGVSFRGVISGPSSDADYWDIKWNRSGKASADPRVRGHRHDQTVAGILAHRLGMHLATEGLESISREDGDVGGNTVVVIHRDFVRDPSEKSVLGRIRSYLWRRSTRRTRTGRAGLAPR